MYLKTLIVCLFYFESSDSLSFRFFVRPTYKKILYSLCYRVLCLFQREKAAGGGQFASITKNILPTFDGCKGVCGILLEKLQN